MFGGKNTRHQGAFTPMQSKIRSLASDTLVYGVSTVIGRFMTFMLTPLYSNYMTASEIGAIAGIYSVIALVNVAYSLGMEPAFMRFWTKTDELQTRRVFTVAYVSILCLGLVTSGLTILFAEPIAHSKWLQLDVDGARIIALASLIPLFDSLVLIPFAQLRMQRKAKRFAIMRLLTIVIHVALNIVFVVMWRMGIEGVIWAGIISSGTTFLVFIPDIKRTLTRFFDKQVFTEMLRFGLPTVPSSFSSVMVAVVDRPIMLLLTSQAMVGMYQTNFRLAIPMMLFVQVFEYAWRPFYLHHRDDPDAKQTFARVLTLFTVACGFVFLITALFMPYVVQLPGIGGRFINPDYWSGLVIVPIVLVAYYLNGIAINFAAGFNISKNTLRLPIATGIAAAINVIATFALVPSMSITGAAWAKVAAYAASAVVLLLMLKHVYPIRYDWKRISTIVLCAAAVYVGVLLVPGDMGIQIAARILAIPVFLGLLLLTRAIGMSTLLTLRGLVQR